MPLLYYLNVTVHVLAAMLWLGGMLFLGVVGAPVLRALEPPTVRQQLFHTIGTRFRSIGWGAIATLVLTGTVNLHYRGWLQWDAVFASAAFWRTATGHALAIKLAAVTLMIAVSAVHDFILGPAAVRAVSRGDPGSDSLRRRAALIARANALLGLVVVAAAVRLAR